MFKRLTQFVLLLTIVLSTSAWAETSQFSQRPDVAKFINHMVTKYHFNKQNLDKLFDQTNINPEIIKRITTPYEGKPWYIYRRHFLTQTRVDQGVKYWQENKQILDKAEKIYGVPPSVIVALVGVESRYGQYKGTYSVFNSLSTLAFGYPPRSKFFTRELEQFLLLSRKQGVNPLSVKGSYAGAIGQPQFMPSSYRAYAVDFSKSGYIDLSNNTADVIGSIANYLSVHGWKKDQPVVEQAKITGDKYKTIKQPKGNKPKLTLQQMQTYGVTAAQKQPLNEKVRFIELQQKVNDKVTPEYWLGFNNFYVITRYNHSPLYAMAVYQLSQDIASAHAKELKEQAKG